jgi:hypothetical protein
VTGAEFRHPSYRPFRSFDSHVLHDPGPAEVIRGTQDLDERQRQMKLNRALAAALTATFLTAAAAPQLLPTASADAGKWKCTVTYGFPIGLQKGTFAYCHLVTIATASIATAVTADKDCRVHADPGHDGLYELEVKPGVLVPAGTEITGWCDAPVMNGKTSVTLKDKYPPKKKKK